MELTLRVVQILGACHSLGYKPPAPEFIEPIPSFYATH